MCIYTYLSLYTYIHIYIYIYIYKEKKNLSIYFICILRFYMQVLRVLSNDAPILQRDSIVA